MGVAARRAELPSGTVAFLFSDVEGSTRLLTRLPDRYAEVLAEHQRLLRAAFDELDGREVHTEGDAFFVAFAGEGEAIAAAVSAQRSLASQRWPEGADVRVRIGVHTGEAEVPDDDYVGLDVHRAPRICAAGHGGQVLISASTRELVVDELPGDVALRTSVSTGSRISAAPSTSSSSSSVICGRSSRRCPRCRPEAAREGSGLSFEEAIAYALEEPRA